MHHQCVIAEFANIQKAKLGLEVLEKARFAPEQISLVSRKDDPELGEIAHLIEAETEGMGVGASAGVGSLIGGTLAVPLAASTLVGPFILVGPLVGLGLGAAVGGMLGGTRKWGVHQDALPDLEAKVQGGAVLLIVSGDRGELLEAEASLKTAGPESIVRYEGAQARHEQRQEERE